MLRHLPTWLRPPGSPMSRGAPAWQDWQAGSCLLLHPLILIAAILLLHLISPFLENLKCTSSSPPKNPVLSGACLAASASGQLSVQGAPKKALGVFSKQIAFRKTLLLHEIFYLNKVGCHAVVSSKYIKYIKGVHEKYSQNCFYSVAK